MPTPSTTDQLIAEIRACAQHCRPIVEGPAVKREIKQSLRRMLSLADAAASLLEQNSKLKS